MSMLSKRLAEARQMVPDLSARRLSQLAGLESDRHVATIERGEADNPTRATLTALAQTLGCTIDWLARGTKPEPTKEAVRDAIAKATAALDVKKAG